MTPKKRELTEHDNKILALLRQINDWVGRDELAALIGRKKLSNSDKFSLQRLKSADLIEIQQLRRTGPSGARYHYKAK